MQVTCLSFPYFGSCRGIAAIILYVVHDRRAFDLQFSLCCQPRGSLRYKPHVISLENQLRFRQAWRPFRIGNIHPPGGASCKDRGGFLPPLFVAHVLCRGAFNGLGSIGSLFSIPQPRLHSDSPYLVDTRLQRTLARLFATRISNLLVARPAPAAVHEISHPFSQLILATPQTH